MEKKIRLRAFDQLLTRIIGKLQRTRKNLKNQEKLNNLRRLYMEKKSRLRAFARTRAKNAFFEFLGCFRAYARQPHDRIDYRLSHTNAC